LLSTEPLAREALPLRGSCFGFEIRSELPFDALRPSEADDTLRVFSVRAPQTHRGKLVREWTEGGLAAKLLFDGHVYAFVVDGVGSVEVDLSERTLRTFGIDDPIVREEIVCGVPLALCCIARGDLALHAAAVEIDGGAVVLAGPSTYGKSTLAAALTTNGNRLLSEDLVCLRPGLAPSVLPGPAALRLRRDVIGRVSVGASDESRVNEHRTRLTIDSAARGGAEPVPLRAVFLLRSSEDEGARTTQLSLSTALPDLWALCLRLDSADEARCFRGLVDVVSGAPVYDLHRRLRVEDLPATISHIANAVA
jgi:hypothetical protein